MSVNKEILWHWFDDKGVEWYAWKEGESVFYCEVGNQYEWHDKCRVDNALTPLIIHALSEAKKKEVPA